MYGCCFRPSVSQITSTSLLFLHFQITMRKFSSVHRVRSHNVHKEMETGGLLYPGPKLSFVEEMHNNFDSELTPGGPDTPNSQNMTDTDPPSKSFAAVKGSRPPLQGNAMKAISENSELDNMGTDEDWKKWDNYQNRRESHDGLFNEIADMKSKVRQEIENMGGKMNHLEQNVSMILSLLKERDLPTAGRYESHLLTGTPGSDVSRSRTATIVSRAKAGIPEETLPDWVEMENFGMAGDFDADADFAEESFAVAEETKEEMEEEPELAKPAKKASRKSERKAKKEEGEKRKREGKSKGEEENTSATPQITEEENERESRQEVEEERHEDKEEDKARVTSAKEETPRNVSRMSRAKDEDEQEPSAVEETDGRLSQQSHERESRQEVEEERHGDKEEGMDRVTSAKEETPRNVSRMSRAKDEDEQEPSAVEETDGRSSQQSQRGEERQDNSDDPMTLRTENNNPSRLSLQTDRNHSRQSRHVSEEGGEGASKTFDENNGKISRQSFREGKITP